MGSGEYGKPSLQQDHICIFAGSFNELFLAVQKPHRWPALEYQEEELRRKLALIGEFQLRCVSREEDRGASIIAQSVTREKRLQSYVAAGHPDWLFEVFVNESCGL